MLAFALPMAFVVAPPPGPDPLISGPAVSSSRASVEPGRSVVLTIDGFASPYVTISICGNEARRGSTDCNMAGSEGVEIPGGDGPLVLEMPVAAPPADCPCVIRVVGSDTSEVAITPLVVTGHPVRPLVDPAVIGELFDVSIRAREAPQGLVKAVRSALGGPTSYEVTLTVKNRSTTPLKQVKASGSAGRRAADDSLVTLDFADPELLGVGQTWQQTIVAVVPAPLFGSVEWRVAVSGAGPTVNSTSTTRHRPILLIVMILVVVFNVFLLILRWVVRRRIVRQAKRSSADPVGAVIDATSSDEAPILDSHESLKRSLVGSTSTT